MRSPFQNPFKVFYKYTWKESTVYIKSVPSLQLCEILPPTVISSAILVLFISFCFGCQLEKRNKIVASK